MASESTFRAGNNENTIPKKSWGGTTYLRGGRRGMKHFTVADAELDKLSSFNDAATIAFGAALTFCSGWLDRPKLWGEGGASLLFATLVSLGAGVWFHSKGKTTLRTIRDSEPLEEG